MWILSDADSLAFGVKSLMSIPLYCKTTLFLVLYLLQSVALELDTQIILYGISKQEITTSNNCLSAEGNTPEGKLFS